MNRPEQADQHLPITLAITGASGVQYGLRLLQCLVSAQKQVHFMISKAAMLVVATETELKLPVKLLKMQQFLTDYCQADAGQIKVFDKEQWTAPVASGSANSAGMVICPCSTGTLSAIASGACNNLIERAADVNLKERRPLILIPREAPYSVVHLQNMLAVTQAGGTIIPASPGFYHQPQGVEDMVDFIVARIMQHLNIAHNLLAPWGIEQ